MNYQREVSKIDFLNIAPYVRYVHEYHGLDDYKIQSRTIYDYKIIFVKKGKCVNHIENQEYILQSGDILLMHPHVQHSCYVPKGKQFSYNAVHFDLISEGPIPRSLLRGNLFYMGERLDFSADDVYVLNYAEIDEVPVDEELDMRPVMVIREVEFPYLLHSRESRRYNQYFHRLLMAYQTKEQGYHMEMRACLLMVLKVMVRDLTAQEVADKGHFHYGEITEIIQYMYNNYDKQLDFNKLAQSIFISPNYFRVLCKQAAGKTPVELLT